MKAETAPLPKTPEGALIETARRQLRISQNEAGSRMRNPEVSGSRWRALVYGYRSGPNGTRVPINPTAETWARMAVAVNGPPQAFERLRPPRRDIAAYVRRFNAEAQESRVVDQTEIQRVFRLLIILREQVGEEVYEAAADALILSDFTRRRGPDTNKVST